MRQASDDVCFLRVPCYRVTIYLFDEVPVNTIEKTAALRALLLLLEILEEVLRLILGGEQYRNLVSAIRVASEGHGAELLCRYGSDGYGVLIWRGESYRIRTGPYGKGPIPPGRYGVSSRITDDDTIGRGFTDAHGDAWFIGLDSPPGITRSGFGMHPDLDGTKGCIGLQGDDAGRFWAAWKASETHPETLTVVRG